MYISKTRFINWTRCPMYFAMDLKHNPLKKTDIDAERERREEMLAELMSATARQKGLKMKKSSMRNQARSLKPFFLITIRLKMRP